MKDCIICGAMIPFYGSDICQSCKDRIAKREAEKSRVTQLRKEHEVTLCQIPSIYQLTVVGIRGFSKYILVVHLLADPAPYYMALSMSFT